MVTLSPLFTLESGPDELLEALSGLELAEGDLVVVFDLLEKWKTKGKKLTAEHRKKISDALKGRGTHKTKAFKGGAVGVGTGKGALAKRHPVGTRVHTKDGTLTVTDHASGYIGVEGGKKKWYKLNELQNQAPKVAAKATGKVNGSKLKTKVKAAPELGPTLTPSSKTWQVKGKQTVRVGDIVHSNTDSYTITGESPSGAFKVYNNATKKEYDLSPSELRHYSAEPSATKAPATQAKAMPESSAVNHEIMSKFGTPKSVEYTDKNMSKKKVAKLLGVSESEVDTVLHNLGGGQAGAKVTVGHFKNQKIISVDSQIGDVYSKTSTTPAHRAYRALRYDESGKIVGLAMASFEVKNSPNGTGTAMFAHQVKQAQKLGIKELDTLAAQSKTMNGYYTWARLGYNAKFKEPEGPTKAADIHQLMSTPEGRAHWKKNGESTPMTFDLAPGSQSMKILEGYAKAKGVWGDEPGPAAKAVVQTPAAGPKLAAKPAHYPVVDQYSPAFEKPTKTWAKSLSKTEREAISTYIGMGSHLYNPALRTREYDSFKPTTKAYFATLDGAIAKSGGAPQSMTVFRGVPPEVHAQLKVGHSWKDPAYTSSSVERGEAEGFSNNLDVTKSNVMEIRVKKGQAGAYLDAAQLVSSKGQQVAGYSEWLFPRSSSFRVVEKKADGTLVLEVE